MRSISRVVSVALIPALMPVSVPVAVAAPTPPPAPARPVLPPAVAPNRTLPRVTAPALRPSFSDPPSQPELARARVFEEPLAAAGATTARENRALGHALMRYVDAADPENLAPLEGFLKSHPASGWRVAVVTNLGLVTHGTGYFSKALHHYEEAWRLGKDASEPGVRALADRAVSEWAWLLMGLGHQDRLAKLLEEVDARPFSGSSAQRIQTARQGLWLMRNRPEEAFRCGPVALSRVLLALGHPPDDRVAHAPGTPRGTSLAQVRRLAGSVGVNLQMGKRTSGRSPLPAPAVVHFKTGHFAAVVQRSGSRYLVADPVFNEERWVSTEALDAETTGYVLAADLPEGFSPVGDSEADTIWGRSCPTQPDPTQQQPCEDTSGGDCESGLCGGMAGYTFLSLLTALRIKDTPLRYAPPKGPAVNFTFTYNQMESFQPAVFSYANVGPKWTFDAISYVEDDPSTTAAQTVKVYRRGGGMEVFALPDDTQPSPPDFRTRAVLVRASLSPIKYERRMPDGSVETFAQPAGGSAFPRKVFMTEEADPQGNKVVFLFNDTLQLEAVVDALGQVSLLTYGDPSSPHRVTEITDPFGRTAKLTYDGQGRVNSITDTLGLTSSFSYGDGDFITSMTTPYGTTRFTSGHDGNRIWIEAEDPLGARERAEFVVHHDSSIGPRFLPPSEVPAGFEPYNGNFDAGLTLFWDKRAMLLAPLDVSKADIKHWLEHPTAHRPRGIVRAHKKALESRVWYVYQGQITSHGNDGRLVKKGRLLTIFSDVPPLPTVTQAWNYTHNNAGKPCSVIDPLGRETRYTYATNNIPDPLCSTGSSIDLFRVEQKNGAGWDMVQKFTYNIKHLPLTMTDDAEQTTTYTYNAAGRVTSVTTPPRAGITEERTTTYTYQPQTGYLLTVVSPGTVTTSYTYDAYGRVRTMTNNDDDTTTYDYDVFDRPTRTTHPDGTYDETAYDRLDAARFRDRLGRWSETFRDPLRRVVATRDPAGRETHQEWCICGSLSRLIDPNGNATTWEHDIQGRVKKEIRANGSFKEYAYELSTSQLRSTLDAKGQSIIYDYKLDDRLEQIFHWLPEHPTPTVDLVYTDPATGQPDAHGRLRKLIDGTGQTTYTYVPFGQLGAGRVLAIDGPFANDTITYGYDELGRVVSRNFDGVTSTWSYDQQWRLASQTDPIGTFSYTYHGNAQRLAVVVYPNNQTSIYDYWGSEDDRRLSQVQHRKPSNAQLNVLGYSYDDVGNIKTWTQQIDHGTIPEEYHLEYDPSDQLVAATLKDGYDGTTILKRYRYAYDPAGNRTAEQIDDAATGATHDDMNRLLSQQPGGTLLFRGTTNEPTKVTVQAKPATTTAANQFSGNAQVGSGPTNVVVQATDYASPPNVRTNTYQVTQAGASKSFTYDANGNLTSDGTKTYEWDAEDRLISVKQGTTLLGGFTYDGYGRRSSKATQVGFESLTYIWDGDEVLQERSSQLNPRRYIRGPGIDNHLAVVEQPGATTYFIADHLGSVVRATNSAGNPILTRKYDPWGGMLQGASTSGYAYTGREWDAETGLYYYRARYYDPRTARFNSEDPLGLADDVNRYRYVKNQPTTEVDPFGLCVAAPPQTPSPNPSPPPRPDSGPDCAGAYAECTKRAKIMAVTARAACYLLCWRITGSPNPFGNACQRACSVSISANLAAALNACKVTYMACLRNAQG